MSKVKVTNLKLTDVSPGLKFKPANDLLPKQLKPLRCSFEIHGVSTAIVNGIRRALQSEILVKALCFDRENFDTNDDFMLDDFVLNRIKHIPIEQTVSDSAIYNIDVINNTHQVMIVKSDSLKGGRVVFDDTIHIAMLQPNKYLRIKNISIVKDYGYKNSAFSVTCGQSNVPIDVEPLNLYEKTGVSSSVANPRKHRISFETNGTMHPRVIVVSACREIISRLSDISKQTNMIQRLGNKYKLLINGENDTTGNIIMKTATELYPDIPAITYMVNESDKVLDITIDAETPDEVIISSCKEAIATTKRVMEAFG